MALRIRRGLSADRTSITPEQGEFLYTTDTYQVYMGDGVTAGGRPLYTLTSLGAIGLTDLSATSPLSYNNTTGQFSIQVATGSQDGYLSSANWTTFNNKQNAIEIFDETTSIITNPTQIKFVGTPVTATVAGTVVTVTISGTGGGGGGVTGVSVATANGLAGVSDLNATNPTLTLSTTITGLLKGNGTAISAATAGTDYQAALTGTGLVASSGGTISYVTNNSSDWNTAYSQRLSSLTTTGNSGAATLIANVLNIPNYTAAGIGAIAATRTIATTTPLQGGGDLSADRTLSILQASSTQDGYLSSANWVTFNGKQNALSGTGIVKSTAGTITYLTDNSSNWDTAFGWGNHASAGYLLSSTAATTYVPQTRNLTIDGVTQNLTADRTFTINKALNDLTDVTTASPLGGDLLQYNGATSQWINVPLSVLTSVGADNGLSFSGGNVILGGELDNATTINTYNTATTTQHSLAFTAGATAFSSPGTAPLRVTDTTTYAAGRSTFYVGANDNHAISVEGKGAPVTTAPTYKYQRTSANLLKNATIHSKAKQGLGMYTVVDSDETYTSFSRYATPTIPGVLVEKTTGLITNAFAGVTLSAGDPFGYNQLFNLLTLRLTRSATTSNFLTNYGVEMSFESQYGGTSDIVKFADLRAYKSSNIGEGSIFSITTRSSLRNAEYTGLILTENGKLTLPAYASPNTLFKYQLQANVTSGQITSVVPILGDVGRPIIQYDDTVTVEVINEDPSLTITPAVLSPTLGYSLKRIRITNPGSGYVTAPSVTIAAPPSGGTPPPFGNGWSTGVQAAGTAYINAAGQVEYIQVTAGTRYTTIPAVTIAPPPSGVTATAVAEFGQGEVLFVSVSSPGSGYVSSSTKVVVKNQTYITTDPPNAYLGVDTSGQVVRSPISLDYLLNADQTAPFGSGSTILHDTQLLMSSKSFAIASANNIDLTAGKVGASFGAINLAAIDGGRRLYRRMQPDSSNNEYYTGLGISMFDKFETADSNSLLLQTAFTDATVESGGAFNYYAYNATSDRVVEIYASCSNDAASQSGQLSGAKAGFYLLHNLSTSSFIVEHKQINFNLTSNQWGTTGDGSVFASHIHFLQQNNDTTVYDVELGSGYKFNASGYLEDAALAASGTYTADMLINTGSQEGFRGIELAVNSDFDSFTGGSKIQVSSTKVYIKPNNLGTINQVLKVANATTGELGYTTLSTVATSGSYADLSGTPTIPTTLDSLTNVNAPTPSNGQVLSYNTGASEWQAVTFSASGLTLQTNTFTNANQSTLNLQQGTNITIVDSGTGTVTINSSGGSGGVGLDSVFMLMGA